MDVDEEYITSDNSSDWNDSDQENSSESEEESLENVRSWCKHDLDIPQPAPPAFPFTGNPGIKISRASQEPVDYFDLFFDDELIDYIVIETNRFADEFLESNELTPSSRAQDWTDTNPTEMRLFLAILIYEGIIKKPVEEWYWSKRESICSPIINEIMPRKRFSVIMKFLHFTNNNSFDVQTHPQPRLKKIYEVYKLLCKKFQDVYIPERRVAIDESLIPFKGKLGFKQYIPSKRARFGIKLFELCESESGYIWNMIIYTGKDTPFQEEYQKYSMPTKCVMTLMKDVLGKGYCLYLDNFYTSPELAELLITSKTDVCGTVRQNRKNLPALFKMEKLEKGNIAAYQKGKMCLLKWQDKKTVSILSTIHATDMEETISRNKRHLMKPKAVVDYNTGMGGVDKSDQCMSYYPAIRGQQTKYYKKIFRHFIDQAILNSYILYKKEGGSMRHIDFRLGLFEGLVKKYKKCEPPANIGKNPSILRLSGRHFPKSVKENKNKKYAYRRCVVCSAKSDENGKRKRKETRYECKICNVGLCVDPCFEIFHTIEHF